MTELSNELSQVSLELIDEYGAEIALIRKASDEYDPETSSAASDEKPDTFKAIIEDLKGPQFAGNLVQGGDKKLTAAASKVGEAPSIASRVEWGEGQHTVIGTKITRLGAVPILFEIHVRK